MTKFDKNPGATSFAEMAIDQLGTAQDNALMGSLARNFAERRQRREAEAQARQEMAAQAQPHARAKGKINWAARLNMSPELRAIQPE